MLDLHSFFVNSRIYKMQFATICTSFLLMFSTLFIGVTPMNFTAKEINSGLIFKQLSNVQVSYESFTLIYYTNLTEYLELKTKIKACYDTFDSIRNQLNARNFVSYSRRSYYRQLMSSMVRSELEISTYIIPSQTDSPKKEKRAIEFIGKIFNWAFGLMDADSAREVDKKILATQNAVNELRNLGLSMSTFARENLLTAKDKLSKFAARVNEIIHNLNALNKGVQASMTVNSLILEIDTMIEILYNEHQFLTNQILKLLQGAISGQVTHLIPLDSLSEDLINLEKSLPDKLKLPINVYKENALNIFKFSTTRAAIYRNRMLIEINIPRVDRETYSAFEIIPIPIKINNSSSIILPSISYILINQITSDYIPIDKIEYTSAISNFDGTKIIRPSNNIFHDFQYNCEMNIFLNSSIPVESEICNIKTIPNSNIFIPINDINQYFLSLSSPITLNEFCYGRVMKKYAFNSSGFLTIPENCRINSKSITIRSKLSSKIEKTTIIPLSSNFTSNLTLEDSLKTYDKNYKQIISSPDLPQILIQDITRDFNRLIEKAGENIIQAQKTPELSPFTILAYDFSSDFGMFCFIAFSILLVFVQCHRLSKYLRRK